MGRGMSRRTRSALARVGTVGSNPFVRRFGFCHLALTFILLLCSQELMHLSGPFALHLLDLILI